MKSIFFYLLPFLRYDRLNMTKTRENCYEIQIRRWCGISMESAKSDSLLTKTSYNFGEVASSEYWSSKKKLNWYECCSRLGGDFENDVNFMIQHGGNDVFEKKISFSNTRCGVWISTKSGVGILKVTSIFQS